MVNRTLARPGPPGTRLLDSQSHHTTVLIFTVAGAGTSPPPPPFCRGDGWASSAAHRQALAGDEHPPGNTSSCLVTMDPKHSAEVSKHLDKQNQALMETYRAMSHELHKLQVEEETIMRKLYELMSAEGLLPKRKKEMQQEEKGVASTPENKEWEP